MNDERQDKIKQAVREVVKEMVDSHTFKISEIRLTWEESQEHYLALHEIEEKAWNGLDPKGKIANGKRKKIEAKIHNDTNLYLREKELIQKLGGFYKTCLTSPD